MIRNLNDLAEHVGASSPTRESVARRLFKDTRCGISFYVDDARTYVSVAGYTEGVDATPPPRVLRFPFEEDAFDAAVEAADEDGCALWDETHGCENCGTGESGVFNGLKPVDPLCETCEGGGAVF